MILDHAHCEKKAASTALNLLFRYPGHPDMATQMSEIVQEEMEHFDQVLRLMDARGWSFERQTPSNYAGRLQEFCTKQEPQACIDRLLMCALIEARSCERFQILGEHLADAELRAFYQSLFESEARHYATYLKLALRVGDERKVRARLAAFAVHEAEMIGLGDAKHRLHA
jgi:tRNA-(ms[2]io[6]A)-hydroxylase